MNDLQTVPQETRVERLSASQIRADVNLIQEVMKAVMQKDVHYGVIKGCGEKPTLLKPGAEKIAATFRLAIDPVVEDLSNSDEIRFRVTAKVTHQVSGLFLGSGIGEASTSEEKYKWRSAVCKQEFQETPDDRRRSKWKAGWQDKPAYQVEQVRTNPADVANTVLKMAKKRALIDAVLTITGASDIFTQDIEDMPEELAASVATEKDAPVAMPKAKEAVPTSAEPSSAPKNAPIPARDKMRKMESKKEGKCGVCTDTIDIGEPIYWDGGTFSAYHPECVGA